MDSALRERLRRACAAALPDRAKVEIENLTEISSGWESEMYVYDLVHGPDGGRRREGQVLRLYPGDSAEHVSEREYRGLGTLHRLGYPVPRVFHLERDRHVLGKPFVLMERIEGEPLMRLWMQATPEQHGQFLITFCSLLVRLHRLDWRPFVADPTPYERDPYAIVDAELASRRRALARLPVPGMEPVLDWLQDRRDSVPCPRPAPVHWDYHPDNLLIKEDGSAVVIDWTQVCVSDPRFDLAWTLMLASAHVSPDLAAAMRQGYERLSGEPARELDFFMVYVCLKRLYGVVVSRVHGPEKVGMRPEAVAITNNLMPTFAKVYAMLLDRTHIPIPEVEAMLG